MIPVTTASDTAGGGARSTTGATGGVPGNYTTFVDATPDSGLAETDRCDGGMPPDLRNHLAPTGEDRPASRAASSLVCPAAIPAQNRASSARRATGGRPGERNARPEPRPFIDIATSQIRGVATTG